MPLPALPHSQVVVAIGEAPNALSRECSEFIHSPRQQAVSGGIRTMPCSKAGTPTVQCSKAGMSWDTVRRLHWESAAFQCGPVRTQPAGVSSVGSAVAAPVRTQAGAPIIRAGAGPVTLSTHAHITTRHIVSRSGSAYGGSACVPPSTIAFGGSLRLPPKAPDLEAFSRDAAQVANRLTSSPQSARAHSPARLRSALLSSASAASVDCTQAPDLAAFSRDAAQVANRLTSSPQSARALSPSRLRSASAASVDCTQALSESIRSAVRLQSSAVDCPVEVVPSAQGTPAPVHRAVREVNATAAPVVKSEADYSSCRVVPGTGFAGIRSCSSPNGGIRSSSCDSPSFRRFPALRVASKDPVGRFRAQTVESNMSNSLRAAGDEDPVGRFRAQTVESNMSNSLRTAGDEVPNAVKRTNTNDDLCAALKEQQEAHERDVSQLEQMLQKEVTEKAMLSARLDTWERISEDNGDRVSFIRERAATADDCGSDVGCLDAGEDFGSDVSTVIMVTPDRCGALSTVSEDTPEPTSSGSSGDLSQASGHAKTAFEPVVFENAD